MMDTPVMEETRSPVQTTDPAPVPSHSHAPDRREEIDELLRIKRRYKISGDRVPCPACAMVVENTLNRCPFCDSDIAPGTALARETTRRLRELSGELDAEHGARLRAENPVRRTFMERLKCVFQGDPEPVAPPKADPHARRLLHIVTIGDTLRVVDEDGAWLKVKTQAGQTGWVYSTVREDS
jgi:hypothetical protein